MFARYVYEKSPASYSNRILITDGEKLTEKTDCLRLFAENGFEIIHYTDDLTFRIEHSDILENQADKYLIITAPDIYVPYDIRKRFDTYCLDFPTLFPKLNSQYLRSEKKLNFDLLVNAYTQNYDDLSPASLTKQFIQRDVYGSSNLHSISRYYFKELCEAAPKVRDYTEWFENANKKATKDIIASQCGIDSYDEDVNLYFHKFIVDDFGKLSSQLNPNTPVLVSKAMDYMHEHSEKFAVIVMDAMSVFDWKIISESFTDLKYRESYMFAMIPTMTSISRQCLLSNKYPSQLLSPWTQSKEEEEFRNCALSLGYQPNQIVYHRGYDVGGISLSARCIAIIINDIDDMVHGQKQGKAGMYNDIKLLAKQGNLHDLVKDLLIGGVDVYITADHGNTQCTGTGKRTKTGVESVSKGHRIAVVQDFADKEQIKTKHHMFEYPKYYLDKKFDYLICYSGGSLDAPGETVITHGGISIDEVIVPFISLKAGENNG